MAGKLSPMGIGVGVRNRVVGIRGLVERLAFAGVVPGDSEEIRVQKMTLTLAAVTTTCRATR